MKKQNILIWSALLAACALSFAAIGCDRDPSGNCYYDVEAAIYPEGARESARIFYPCTIESTATVAATTLTSGRGGNKEGLYWLAERIAASGIVVAAVSALDNSSVQGYQVAQRTGLGLLTYANQNSESPLAGKIRACGLIGYSIGGAAAVNVASEQGAQVKTCIALSPYNPAPTAHLSAATLILTCETDTVAPPSMGSGAYEAIQGETPKAYASMVGVGHFFWWDNQDPGSADDYIIAWLKYWLEENHAYAATLEQPQADMTDVRLDAPPLQREGVDGQGAPAESGGAGGGGGGCAIAVITDF
ncbi:MAG: hypothetical protein HY911_14770 [Desulfobacterales bacterium]|nr:hypothetical protein [Desulfobacterales bacterium]